MLRSHANSRLHIPGDFIGLNVATSEDPACDDYVMSCVSELGIRALRLDFTYASFGSFQERLIRRVLADGLSVMLHLVTPADEAQRLAFDRNARERWRAFIVRVFDAYGSSVESFEIGSTPNRRRWSGYGIRGYVAAWQIASDIAAGRNLKLCGPNVTDFEPLYNLALLAMMRRRGIQPAGHTDNLFVERAIEPEAYDPRIAGRLLGKALRFDLERKARVLARISAIFGISETVCAHVSWSGRRIARIQNAIEEKQADYLVRYLMLAAASGALSRVYWGPMIGNREGLIDDGTEEYPATPRVALFDRVFGNVASYKKRPAYFALRNVVRTLHGSQFAGWRVRGDAYVAEFKQSDGTIVHAAWTRDRRVSRLSRFYRDDDLRLARGLDREGRYLDRLPCVISERPMFLTWPAGARVGERPDRSESLAEFTSDRVSNVASVPGYQFVPVSIAGWRGTIALRDGDDFDQRVEQLRPDALDRMREVRVLRDARNRVWVVDDPDTNVKLVIKRSPLRTLPNARSGARLAWNNSSEMIRRGINTPAPIAYFEPRARGARGQCYFVCEFVENAFSARHAFNSFRDGAEKHEGFDKSDVFDVIAIFLRKMHLRGVFHGDLSAGNLLMRPDAAGGLQIFVIDTARAICRIGPLSKRERMLDLMRLCHPLDANNRELLAEAYCRDPEARLPRWRNAALAYYDFKHYLKNASRQFRPRR